MKYRKVMVLLLAVVMLFGVSNPVMAAGGEDVWPEVPVLSENDLEAIRQDTDTQSNTLLSDESLTEIMRDYDYQIVDDHVEFTYIEPVNGVSAASEQKTAAPIFKSVSIMMLPKEGELYTLVDTIESIQSGTQSNYRSDTDATKSITGYITVYFQYYTYGGNEFVGLTSVSGGYKKLDSNIRVSSQSVYMAQNGRTYANGSKQQSTTKNLSGTTWSFNAPSGWYPILTGSAGSFAGANYKFTMTRGASGSSWSHTVYNSIEGNPISPIG